MPASPVYDRYQSGEGYHVVPPPYTGTFMPLKPDLVFHDAPNGNIGWSGEGVGTVSMGASVRECRVREKGFRRENGLETATLDESNLWHRRLGHIKFKTMNKLVKGNLVRGLPSKVFENNHTCVACKKGKQHRASCKTKPVSSISQPLQRTASISFMRPFGCHVTILNTLDPLGKFDRKADEGFLVGDSKKHRRKMFNNMCFFPYGLLVLKILKTLMMMLPLKLRPEFEVEKPEFKVHVSLSSSAKTKKHDDKTKKEAKGKSPDELSIGFRNLSEEFKDFFNNSINKVNAASTPVPAVRQITTNSTNTFSVAGPSNTAVSLTLGESLYVDPSQYPDDLNMPALEDITYSDDEEDIGVEADFTNLETTINVSLIPTTRVHKDHPVTQIIGDLSIATQTRSMTRMVKDQGGLTQINNEDFRTYMFACFLSQEEPKRDERGIVVRNKARLVAQGHTQEEGIDYEEVFTSVARIEAIRFKDPDYPDKVYKVVKALYGLHQAPRACQDKYVAKILRKFGLKDGKLASTPIDTKKTLLKDPDGEDMDVYTYRSMIGSLMYLTSSRLDIMFAVYACACFQVTPKASHVHAIKRIFRYLKGKPHLGLWHPKDSPFNLVAYSDSDYAGASIDRKSTTGGCQFLRCRLISWQFKKQIVVATLATKAEYVAAAS
nr:uncharacterized mitochondrial protein AtMg00810-like [Tanacetum cinerariifolium]